jgi:hypothetical protein
MLWRPKARAGALADVVLVAAPRGGEPTRIYRRSIRDGDQEWLRASLLAVDPDAEVQVRSG